MSKLSFLSSEIFSCQSELKTLQSSVSKTAFSGKDEISPIVSDKIAERILTAASRSEYFDDFKYIWSFCRKYNLMSRAGNTATIHLDASRIVSSSVYVSVKNAEIWFGDVLSEREKLNNYLDVAWKSSHNIELILTDSRMFEKRIKIRDRSGEFDFNAWTKVMGEMFGIEI